MEFNPYSIPLLLSMLGIFSVGTLSYRYNFPSSLKPEDIKQIFDPFFTKKEKGTGLGLSITLVIIEKHAGKIAVNSTISRGTTFTIYLPTI